MGYEIWGYWVPHIDGDMGICDMGILVTLYLITHTHFFKRFSRYLTFDEMSTYDGCHVLSQI